MKKFFVLTLSVPLLVLAVAAPLAALADPFSPPSPPKEAFDACASSKEGDACSVHFGEREIKGTCAPFSGQGLACRPEGGPPPPPRP
jgi:hypothetical protein